MHPNQPKPTVDYDDEVTPEQIAKIEEMLKPEFAKGDWVTVESDADLDPKPA